MALTSPSATAEKESTRDAEPKPPRRIFDGRYAPPAAKGLALLAILTLLAILVYGEHARDGGWVGDAWTTRAWYLLYPHTDFFATVGHFLDLDSMSSRPGNAVYRVALNEWFGGDISAWFAWQIASCVCMCLALYALMRELKMPSLDAGAVSVLLALFPASTALWLWSPIVHASLAVTLAALGFLSALRAFRAEGNRRILLHLASLLLFVLSLLLYEICLPFFLASFLLYGMRASRRAAAARWLLDCVVLLPIALAVSGSTEARDQGVSGSISHAGEIASQLPTLLFGTLLSLGGFRVLALLAVLALYLWGFATMRRRPLGDPTRARLRQLFAISGAGFTIIVLGYSIYVPGLDYYQPLGAGIGDRINITPAIGWTLCLYALAAFLGVLLTQRMRRASLSATVITVALTVGLGISWLAPVKEESRAYVDAAREGERAIDVVERAVPDPPRRSAIWLFGQPVEVAPGVPVFANYWNMSAGVALAYGDHRIRGFVGLPGTRFECEGNGVVPGGNVEYPPPPAGQLGRFGSRYGKTYFVDTVNGQFARIDSRHRCLELRYAYPRSPLLPPSG